LPLDNSVLGIIIVVQQCVTESNGAVSEEEKIVVSTKIILNLMKQNVTRIHRRKLLKIGHDPLY
jgi:hypothetical protein